MRKHLICLIQAILLLSVMAYAHPDQFSPAEIDRLKQKAEQLLEAKNYEQAVTTLKPLCDQYRQTGQWEAYLSLGLDMAVYRQREKKPKAFQGAADLLTELIENTRDKLPAQHPDLLMAHHKLGVSQHYLGMYNRAIKSYAKALEGRRKNFARYEADIIRGHFNIGYCYYEMGNYDRALERLHESLRLQPTAPTGELHKTYRILARTYRETGDIEQADRYHSYLLEHYRSIATEKPWLLAEFYIDLSVFHQVLGKPDRSIAYANEALALLSDMDELYFEDSLTMANAYQNIADAMVARRAFQPAIEYYWRAHALKTKCYGPRHKSVADIYNNLGLAYDKMGDCDQALSFLKRALEIQEDAGQDTDLSIVWENLADVWRSTGDLDRAVYGYQQAIRYNLPYYDREDYRHNPSLEKMSGGNRQAVILVLAAKAQSLQARFEKEGELKDLELAFETFQRTSELIDEVRLSYQADLSKGFLMEQTRSIYENAIVTALRLHELCRDPRYLEAAFTFSEKSKSIILLDAISQSNAGAFAGVAPNLRDRDHNLRLEMTWLEKELAKAKTAGRDEEVRRMSRDLLELQHERTRLLDTM